VTNVETVRGIADRRCDEPTIAEEAEATVRLDFYTLNSPHVLMAWTKVAWASDRAWQSAESRSVLHHA
jgi:hypothetical protein